MAYVASKGAVIAMTRSMARELHRLVDMPKATAYRVVQVALLTTKNYIRKGIIERTLKKFYASALN